MKIISISVNEETDKAIQNLIKSKGFAGRSEVIRKAVSKLVEEETNNSLKGEIDAILLVRHPEKNTEALMEVRHAHQNLVQTHIHTHLQNHQCLELFILKGQAEKIKDLYDRYETSKKASSVKLIVS